MPVHVDRAEAQDVRTHQSSFVDMVLLGSATCFASSPSGFSAMSWLAGGGKPCHRAFYNASINSTWGEWLRAPRRAAGRGR